MGSIKLKLSNHEILSCAFSSDGNLLAGGEINGKIFFFERKKIIKAQKIFKIHSSAINKILFDANYLYTASSDKTCKMSEINSFKIIRTFNPNLGKINDMDIFENLIVTSGDGGNLKIWDKRICFPVFNFHFGFNLKFSKFFKNSFSFLALGLSSEILFGDLRNYQKNILRTSFKMNIKNIVSFCVSKTNSFFYSLNENGQICKWFFNFEKNSLKYLSFFTENSLFKKQNFFRNKIACSFQDKYIIHGSSTGFIYIYDQNKKSIIKAKKNHFDNVNEIIFHGKNNLFCTSGKDGNMILDNFLQKIL
jgi:WD40 repeat protein